MMLKSGMEKKTVSKEFARVTVPMPLLILPSFSFVLDLTGGSSEDAVCSLPNDRSHPASSIVLKGRTSSNML